MAEQDKPTLVPAVLNDLMDVDGTAAEGDGLAYSTGAWRPGPAAGLLPENGPVVNVWRALYDTSPPLANQSDVNAATSAVTLERDPLYADYPGTHPTMGRAGLQSNLNWVADEPGFYTWHVTLQMTLSGTVTFGTRLQLVDPQPTLENWIHGARPYQLKPTADEQNNPECSGTLIITQRMLDYQEQSGNEIAGLYLGSLGFQAAGSETITAMEYKLRIYRWSPGSAFDYFGEL